MKKLLFIYNPNTAAAKLRTKLMEVLNLFAAEGYELTVHPTTAAGDARDTVARRGGRYSLVVCCGGDGTMNETVSGLMALPPAKRPRLGYIPCGTTNDFASSLLLPKSDVMAAARRIMAPKKHFRFDVGDWAGKYFTYVAAFGAFTDVAYSTPQRTKNALGYFAYLLEAVQRLPNLHPTHIRFCCEQGIFEDDYLFGMLVNSVSVGGFTFPEKRRIRLDDGVMEVLLVRHPQNLADLTELSAALLSKNVDAHPHLVTALHFKQASFEAERPVSWTLDGEFGGELDEAAIAVHHQAVEICI